MNETIFALSSGAPPAAIAIVRISGPEAARALRDLAGELPPPRRARTAALRDSTGQLLDRALVLWLPGPHSATGEDIAELHLHGGRAVVSATLHALAQMPGLRGAAPGEFTRRALENGFLDLVEAEGLADLLTAETEGQRRNALALAEGALSRKIEDWRVRILDIAAQVEALLDFDDEEDVHAAVDPSGLNRVAEEVHALLAAPPVERLRDGIRVAIAGPPNAGKSTLLNAIVGREAAITSDIPGTTRDIIEVPVSIGGVAFLLSDTAGLRDTEDALEMIGICRARSALDAADLLLWLGDDQGPRGAILLHARCDVRPALEPSGRLLISAKTGRGIEELKHLLVHEAAKLLPTEGEVSLNQRQRMAMTDLAAGLAIARANADPVLQAEGLRHARAAIDAVTGRAGIEEMLDSLFGRFCIGK